MKTVHIAYTLTRLTRGYIARCAANPVATAYGETEDEAGENLMDAIRTYARLYPDRAGNVVRSLPTKSILLDDAGRPL